MLSGNNLINGRVIKIKTTEEWKFSKQPQSSQLQDYSFEWNQMLEELSISKCLPNISLDLDKERNHG